MKLKYALLGLLVTPVYFSISNTESQALFLNQTQSDEIVNIEDNNLLKAINNQLGRGEVLDNVTISDMESLTTLNANNRNITSIKGIEKAVNLTSLNLSENKIVDVSYLSSLTQLNNLYLYDNQISNIEGFDKLVNLERLYLGWDAKRGNTVSNLTPIKDLSKIKILHLGRNNISDLSLLSNLTTLNELYIECNNLNSLNGIEGLVNLSILDFHGNNIQSLEPIKNLNNLINLYAGKGYYYYGTWLGYGNQISDILALGNLTKLTTLYLHNNQISDISVLENLTNLTNLQLHNNQILDISVLENLTNLTSLQLHNNQISDISVLENLTNLTTLTLNNNQVSDISALGNLTNLTNLQLYNNQISDISALDNLINLTTLNLYNNQISDISSLENLTNLTNLQLHNNQISDISALENLTNLKDLRLNNNQVSDIAVLENLTKLTTLYLHNNQISDISVLENLTKLTNLYLHNNQISDISVLENLTNLTTLYLHTNKILDISALENLTKLTTLYLHTNKILDISALENLTKLTTLYLGNNNISDISALENLTNLKDLLLQNNQVSDISALENLTNLKDLNINNQRPNINISNLKTESDTLDAKINNPLIGLNNNFNVSNISNNGIYENNQLIWSNLSLGSHTNTFNFSQEVKIGSATSIFNGTAKINFNIVDGFGPEASHDSEFNVDDESIYVTINAEDLGSGVDYLIHRGIRYSLPYRFKYDINDKSNNIVYIYDNSGNETVYEVKLGDSDYESISLGVKNLASKDNISSNDISSYREIVNSLEESLNKDLLQSKLNDLTTTETIDKKNTSSNIDIYVESSNMLSMSLNTNNIIFEGYTGTEDLEKRNAIEITINSSLPYTLNTSIETPIINSAGDLTIPNNVLNIKESTDTSYNIFGSVGESLVLNNDGKSGNGNKHIIDLKLATQDTFVADVYKTTIKFEAIQK